MYKVFNTCTVETPHLIGKYIHEVLPALTQYNLNLRLIEQKEDSEIPEGIIISQIPANGSIIKPHQSIFVITTKKTVTQQAPHFIGQSVDAITKQCEKDELTPRIYYVPHPYPHGICFAQYPQPTNVIEKKRITLYISSGNDKPIIWPHFIGRTIKEVTEFLNEYQIKPHIIPTISENTEHVIVDQRPTAGTLLTINDKKTLSVHLRVQ